MKKTWSSKDVCAELAANGFEMVRRDGGGAVFSKREHSNKVKVPMNRKEIAKGT